MKKLALFIILLLLCLPLASAADFVPAGNINGKNIYDFFNFKNIKNVTNITASYFFGDGMGLFNLNVSNINVSGASVNYSNFVNNTNVIINKDQIRNFDAQCTAGNVMVGVDENYTYCDDVTKYNDTSLISEVQANLSSVNATVTVNSNLISGIQSNLSSVNSSTNARIDNINSTKANLAGGNSFTGHQNFDTANFTGIVWINNINSSNATGYSSASVFYEDGVTINSKYNDTARIVSVNNSLNSTINELSLLNASATGLTGLVSYYSFDEDAKDYISGNNGTVVGATQTTYGVIGNAYNFDGTSNALINLGTPSSLNITETSNFTYSLWAKTSSTSKAVQTLISKKGSSNTASFTFRTTPTTIQWDLYNGTTNSPCTYTFTQDDKYHHFVGIFNTTNQILYYDGVLVKNTSYALGGTLSSTANTLIGNKASTDLWNGTIDEVMIFNRSLSASEVKNLYLSYKPNYGDIGIQSLRGELNAKDSVINALATTANTTANTANSTANLAMPKTGGNFSGYVYVPNFNATNITGVQINGTYVGLLNKSQLRNFDAQCTAGNFLTGMDENFSYCNLPTQSSTFLVSNNITINKNTVGQALILQGNATYWLDAKVDGTALVAGSFAPTLTDWNGTLAQLYCYAGSVRNEYSSGTMEFPHSWKEGSTISPHIHVSKSTANAGNYVYNLAGYIKNATGSASITFNNNITISTGGQWDEVIADFPDITPTGFVTGSTYNFRITRLQDNAADTYADCVGIKQTSFHFESDTLGSASEYPCTLR